MGCVFALVGDVKGGSGWVTKYHALQVMSG